MTYPTKLKVTCSSAKSKTAQWMCRGGVWGFRKGSTVLKGLGLYRVVLR